MSLAQQINRVVAPFEVISEFKPAGDQPAAIAELTERIKNGEKDVVLLGATGTGKSATTAWLIEQAQLPTLVMAHNKTLAAQLANEFKDSSRKRHGVLRLLLRLLPARGLRRQTDTYIEKDSSINEEIDRLRHAATLAAARRDVIVVATVSCIYGLGTPRILGHGDAPQGRP